MSVGGIVYGYYNILNEYVWTKVRLSSSERFKLDVSNEVEGGYVRC